MRVVAGTLKGRKLIDNTFADIGPTADIVKQSIFNKLANEVVGARVLDLFAGTGALGIEAFSRGASEVVFVDKDSRAIKLIIENLKNLKIENEVKVLKASFEDALKKLKGQKFDLILVDPPYQSGVYQQAISLICEYDLLSDKGIIVVEQDKKLDFKFEEFDVIDEKVYGIKKVVYLIKREILR